MCDSFETLSWRSRVGAHFSNELQKKDLLVTYLTVLAHMPVLFMRLLVQTAGAENGGTHSRIFTTLKRRFLANRTKYRAKKVLSLQLNSL